jgi:hypothetical protein
MPGTAASLVDVGADRHVEQMLRRFSARVVMLMASHERFGLFGMLSNDTAQACGKGQGQRRGHRPKQICDGEKPCPLSSLWSRHAKHLITAWLQYIASTQAAANSKQFKKIGKLRLGNAFFLLKSDGQTGSYRFFPAFRRGRMRG